MAEKAKGKKLKTMSKKPSGRLKKSDTEELAGVAANKKSARGKTTVRAKDAKSVEQASAELVASVIEASLPPLEQKFTENSEEPREPSTLILPKTKTDGEAEPLSVRLSRSLIRKLKDQAADEGISLEEFVTELLSESVVLRAWEIVERKNQMKGSGSSSAPGGNPRGNTSPPSPNNNNRGHRGNKGQRGMNPMRYQSIMEDKASFLEYVRSQERNRR